MANAARGEVELRIGGETFVLFASLEALGKVEAESGLDFETLLQRLSFYREEEHGPVRSPNAGLLLMAAQHMCISENTHAFSEAVAGLTGLSKLSDAVTAAIMGPPDPEQEENPTQDGESP